MEIWWIDTGVIAIIVICIQEVFLIPVFWKQPPKAPQSRSLKVSIIIAAAIACILTFGLIAALEEFLRTVLETSSKIEDPTGGGLLT